MHFSQHCPIQVGVVVYANLVFARMNPVQSSCVLRKGAFPGNRHCEEESVKSNIIEPFTKITAGCDYYPLLCVWYRSQFLSYCLSLTRTHATFEPVSCDSNADAAFV